MQWKKITAQTDRQSLSRLEAVLWDAGAVSVTVTDGEDKPLFEPGPGETPLWAQMDVCGLFEDDVIEQAVIDALAEAGFAPLLIEVLGDRIWEREWLTRFKPMQFGQRLWVCPTGLEVHESGAVIMDLDPGLAFGTGTHATTRLCLEWLDSAPLSNKRVIDYGCGSGILGIAALLLGADQVLAVDIDPQALAATRVNAEKNHVQDRLSTCMPEAVAHLCDSSGYDVVVANILAQPLIEMSAELLALMKPTGVLVLSGIMTSQQRWVESAYASSTKLVGQQSLDGWVCLQAKK